VHPVPYDVPSLEHLRASRHALIARLPEPGAHGSTALRPPHRSQALAAEDVDADDRDRLLELASGSATGSVLLTTAATITLVIPPFPIEEQADYSEIHVAPLIEVLERQRSLAVVLLRLGGFSLGLFRGETLVDAKTGQRFVKNRHRKGGQSQRRFDRIREKQTFELFGAVCETAREKLDPYEREIEYVLFGGDRHTLMAFRKQCTYFERYGQRVMERVLPVPGDPRRAQLERTPREIWSSDLYVLKRDDTLDAS